MTEMDIKRGRIAYKFMMLPYAGRAAILNEFGFSNREPDSERLPEVLCRLTSEGRLDAFAERVQSVSNISGLFNCTFVARGENPGAERMDELREAAEPLRKYLMKYGDGHTCVTVTPYGATETRDGLRVLYREETLADQEAKP